MIKKTIYLSIGLLLMSSCVVDKPGDVKYLENAAIEVFDGMSKSIGELNSCSFMLQIISDTYMDSVGVVTNEATSDVYMRGPDKMYIHTNSDKGSRGYWYDGTLLTWYNYDKNIFDTLPAPETILLAIDAAHKKYGIDFPAADFFYPTFTDDMISQFDSILYVGSQKYEDENISEVLAVNQKMKVSIWIADNGTQIYPVGFSVIKQEKGNELRYEADFSYWRFNPDLPDDMFVSDYPADAVQKPINH